MPINYQLGKVYKIIDNTNEQCYVGSTCEPILARRLAQHVASYKCYAKGKKAQYISSYEVIKNGDYEMILIENFPCDNKDELHARERHWTNEIPCVNRCKNQGILNEIGQAEYGKKYYDVNVDKLKENANVKCICDCGGKYTFANITRHKKTKKHIKFIETQQADVADV
jgi:hypothetical protein